MSDRRAQVDALLDAALDLEVPARAAFVAAIEDEGLRADVAELLAYAESDTDPIELNARAAAAMLDSLAAGCDEDGLPARIGSWRVIERIGAGGMGVVLKVAREDAGFEQLGALKMMRAGYGEADFSRRFLQERQILARLNHPSIAALLDGGMQEGRPYLVMEFVEGEPIDRYCDERRLGLAQRIELFIEVARALAHAHRQLVVHRDLKPSNILVRPDGRVKLLDFGIAKVLGDEGADSDATRVEQRLFTPDYASPEQARGEAVGTASDVYQLGLLLYELLCGQRAQRIGARSPAEIERAILEDRPARMSQRVSADAHAAAERRGLSVAHWQRALRGDLELIVSKAIEKDRERRYTSVEALVADLERSRRGEPLQARPDSLGYRAWRFLRRHPLGVAFPVTTVLLLAMYAATLWLQSAALERERDRARAEAVKARQVQALVQGLFSGIDPDVSGGQSLSVRELLDRSLGDIERELDAQPEVRAELLLTVGDVYFALGEYVRAGQLLGQAQALTGDFAASAPLLAGRIHRSLGRLEALGNDLALADGRLQRALELLRAGDAPLDVASTLYLLADLRQRQDRFQEADALCREALALRRAHLAPTHADLADSLAQLASLERRAGHPERAEALLEEALAAMQAALPDTHPRLAETRADLASLLRSQGQLEASDALYRQAIAGLDRSRGGAHPFLGIVLNNHGNLLLRLGRPAEAEQAQRRALEIQRNAHGPVHARVALAWNSLGLAQRALDQAEQAAESHAAALAALPASHARWRASFLKNLATAQQAAGDYAAAMRTADEWAKAADGEDERAQAYRVREDSAQAAARSAGQR